MPPAFFPKHAARSVNLGFIAVLAGVLLGESLVQGLIAKLGQRKTLLAAALVSLVPAAGAAVLNAELMYSEGMLD